MSKRRDDRMGESVQAEKTSLPEALKLLGKNKKRRLWVEQNGEPTAVLMDAEEYYDYLDKILPVPESLRKLQEEAAQKGLNQITNEEIDAEIRAVREEKHRKRKSA